MYIYVYTDSIEQHIPSDANIILYLKHEEKNVHKSLFSPPLKHPFKLIFIQKRFPATNKYCIMSHDQIQLIGTNGTKKNQK